MNDAEKPPILIPPALPPEVEAQTPPERPPRAPWRWWAHVLLLAGYVLGIGLMSQMQEEGPGKEAALPGEVGTLLKFCFGELAVFGTIFVVACLFTRPNARELFLKWKDGFKAVLWGVAYSVILRVAIALVLFAVIFPVAVYERATKGDKADVKKTMEGLRPDVSAVVAPEALEQPAYLLVMMTFVSFVVAGLREELWRAGMIAGLAGLSPKLFAGKRGQIFAVMIAAIIFGLGHFAQGIGGVFLTGALGIGLGLIIVRHQSIWQATLAHGFFDATSFALLAALSKFAPEALKNL